MQPQKLYKLIALTAAILLTACGDDSSNPSNNGGISEQDIIIKTACGNIYSDMTFRNEGGDVLGNFNHLNKNIVLIDDSVYDLNKAEILKDGSYACPIKESVSSSSQIMSSPSGAVVSKPSWQNMNPDIEYRLFMDERDEQYYRTVKINNQIWMAENLNYETIESYCYDRETTNCDKYGRLYTWEAAKRACPAGYRLPSSAEWDMLLKFVSADNNLGTTNKAGTYLKSKTGWNPDDETPAGNDKYGFSVLPAGFRYSPDNDGVLSDDMGDNGNFWSSTDRSTYAHYYSLSYAGENFFRSEYGDKTESMSVRCLMGGSD